MAVALWLQMRGWREAPAIPWGRGAKKRGGHTQATLKNKRSSREVKAKPSFLKKRSKKLLFLEAVAGHRSATAT
jgi:hypothetical protein